MKSFDVEHIGQVLVLNSVENKLRCFFEIAVPKSQF